MTEVIGDIVIPSVLVIPKVTTAIRNTLVAEVGTILFDTDLAKIVICKAKAAAAASWEAVTSEEQS